MYRLKGELLLSDVRVRGRGRKQTASEALAGAESCFNRAIEIARSQQSKWFELRAVLSLCRMRQGGSRGSGVRDLLLPIHNWYTEGFDTPDLLAARAFLQSYKTEQ